jgi:hypothetical protein
MESATKPGIGYLCCDPWSTHADNAGRAELAAMGHEVSHLSHSPPCAPRPLVTLGRFNLPI